MVRKQGRGGVGVPELARRDQRGELAIEVAGRLHAAGREQPGEERVHARAGERLRGGGRDLAFDDARHRAA
jgi:hypothetical protein